MVSDGSLIVCMAVGSDLSSKNGHSSSSTSFSESDLENSHSELFSNVGGLDGEKTVAQSGKENILLQRIEEYEKEVQITNAKVKSAEEEAAKFKSKLEEKEAVVKQLKVELEESHELAESKDAVISELERRISSDADELAKYSEEVRRLKDALADSQNVLLQKDEYYQSEMSSLLEQKNLVERISEKQRLQIDFFENEISELKNELVQVKSTLDAKEASWKSILESLEAEKVAKSEDVETLNKCADALKLKYDMANASLETLTAELSHKENMIQQLNEHIDQLTSANAVLNVNIRNLRENQNAIRQLEERLSQSQHALFEAISKSDESSKCIDKLRVRVCELEGELEEQRDLVAEGAELKREAIRQLCISLEHYRSEYHELREAVSGKKRRTRTDTSSGSPTS